MMFRLLLALLLVHTAAAGRHHHHHRHHRHETTGAPKPFVKPYPSALFPYGVSEVAHGEYHNYPGEPNVPDPGEVVFNTLRSPFHPYQAARWSPLYNRYANNPITPLRNDPRSLLHGPYGVPRIVDGTFSAAFACSSTTKEYRKSEFRTVRLRRPNQGKTDGSLAVTGHHLIFSADQESCKGDPAQDELWLLHRAVDMVSVETRSSGTTLLTARCKDLAILVFEFKNAEDAAATARSLEILSNLADVRLSYPFHYRAPFEPLEDGWSSFTTEEYFAALQIHTDFWRLSHVNKGFSVCATYPEAVIVPKSIDDMTLVASAKFREGGRFPVLSYYHKDTRSGVVRCGQPLVGQSNRRCREDETLFSALAGTSARGYILDTRPQQIAQAAKNKGGGYELDQYYPMWKRMHRNLLRWQSLQDSYMKLVEGCNDGGCSTDKWVSRVNGSGWVAALAELLTSACVVAQSLDREEMSVVIHGAEGLDNTIIVSSLVQVLLDPDARTIRGFASVVEREWVAGGHPFGLRCAHAAYAKGKETGPHEAPSFALFIHTVASIVQQYATSFEFREDFLLLILDQAYASEFGTFLGTCEKDKAENKVKQHTVSLWSYINRPETLTKYLNPFFEPNPSPIWPSVAPQSLVLWGRGLFRWTRDWSPVDAAEARMSAAKLEERSLMSQIARIRRQLVEMERENMHSNAVNVH